MSTEGFTWPVEEHAGSWESLAPWGPPSTGVRIERDLLVLEHGGTMGRRAPELAHASFKMLTEFARLSEGDDCATDGSLLAFASRYGGLGLCKEHGWSFVHRRPYCPRDISRTRDGFIEREGIENWRIYSRFVRAVVTVLVERRGALHDAELAFLNRVGDPDARHAILRWHTYSELRLDVLNSGSRPTLYGVPPLWTAIGLELLTFAQGTSGIILCSNCRRLDSVKRPRRVDDQRRAFCARCRNKGRKRLGAADMRRRQRQARELHAQHKSVKEIAAQLGIGTDRVRRYLKKDNLDG
jgi:hypothetical protein